LHGRALAHGGVHALIVAEEQAEKVLAALARDPDIEYVERDPIGRAAFVPDAASVAAGNDWHLTKIQAPEAWTVTPGRTSTIVAVLDSGANAAHPDLAGRLLPAYNFVSDTSDTTDDFGHGTAVAGVVVAAGHNVLGIVGVAYGCSILPIKVMDANGFAAYSAIADGIYYAAEHGARVINISIAGNSPSSTLQDALNYAWSNDVVIVAAAGNNANDALQYPAACDHVGAVSATEPDDSLAFFSSYGNFVAVSAPGDIIWTTQSDLSNPYGVWRGTSFASPVVAGIAALIASVKSSLVNSQIVAILEQNADDLGPAGYDPTFGFGRVNASRAVSTVNRRSTLQPPRFTRVTLSWQAVPGRSYRVQYQSPAGATNWTDLPPDVLATSEVASKTDATGAGQRSYRVLLLP
jgi:subtilisin family serine protease